MNMTENKMSAPINDGGPFELPDQLTEDDEKTKMAAIICCLEAEASEFRHEIAELKAKLSEAERELAEQTLCNGKGAEREADILGKVERLERENARLREALALAIG